MKDIKEISILLVGSWNTKIFTPGWVMNELLSLHGNEEFEIGFNNNLQPTYKYKQIQFIPTDRAFEIRIEKYNEDLIKIANRAAIKLITTLPFTPNLVVGFNYKLLDSCEISNVSIPNYSDKYTISEIKLSKEEPNYILNVILSCGEIKTVVYNFHYKNLTFIKEKTIQDHIDYINKYGN